jgi:hypothetical protein
MSSQNIILQFEQKMKKGELTQENRDELTLLILEMIDNISRDVDETSRMIQDLCGHLGL